MLTIKWTQSNGTVNLLEANEVSIIYSKTEAWKEVEGEFFGSSSNLKAVIYRDGKYCIPLYFGDQNLYIVNSEGKTVQTV
jgi:hypothetical protein